MGYNENIKDLSLNQILSGYEDINSVKNILNKLRGQGTPFDNVPSKDDYVGFSFHENAFHNLKILNLLKEVIPEIENIYSHEGEICIKFLDRSLNKLYFSGESSSEIVKKLVYLKYK
jgi:signal peptidase I